MSTILQILIYCLIRSKLFILVEKHFVLTLNSFKKKAIFKRFIFQIGVVFHLKKFIKIYNTLENQKMLSYVTQEKFTSIITILKSS